MEYMITVDDDGAEMTIKIAHPGARLKDEWDEVRPALIRYGKGQFQPLR